MQPTVERAGPRVADSVLRAYADARTELVEVRFAPGPAVLSRPGESLLTIAEANQVPIESGCRMGICGADAVRIVTGADHVTPPSAVERGTLRRLGLPSACRMACTTRVHGDVLVAPIVGETVPQTDYADSLTTENEASGGARRLVIIGSGVAGVTAAIELREHGPDTDITLLSAERYDFYNRMAINKLLPAATAVHRLSLMPRDWTKFRRIRRLRGVAVRSIDRVRREVHTDGGHTLPYDRLLLATGARCVVPAIDGSEKHGVFVMSNIDDAVRLRQYIREHGCRRAVVVGGGLLGLEAAASISKMDVRVSVLELAAWPLPRQLDQVAGALVRELMGDLGIKILPEVVTRALLGAERVEAVELADGRRLKADVVLLAAGIEPDVTLAERAGLAVDHGVIVDDRMATSDPDIFAAGDTAIHEGRVLGLWPVGVEQAHVAAMNMLGDDCRYELRVPPTSLKVAGLDVLSVGDVANTDGEALEICDHDTDARQYRKLVIRAGKASAAIIVGHHDLHHVVCEAVMAQRDVREAVPALRRGDWSVLRIAD